MISIGEVELAPAELLTFSGVEPTEEPMVGLGGDGPVEAGVSDGAGGADLAGFGVAAAAASVFEEPEGWVVAEPRGAARPSTGRGDAGPFRDVPGEVVRGVQSRTSRSGMIWQAIQSGMVKNASSSG